MSKRHIADGIALANTGEDGARSISPTDIAQFVRLDQCERYLRLRLRERAEGRRFLYDYGVIPQSLPPLLTRSGAAFEQAVERAVASRHSTRNFASPDASAARLDNNAEVVTAARALAVGQVRVLMQVRLHVSVAGWRLRGDLDLLRLECDAAGVLRVLIADMKSSRAARVEHRLQVAFYVEMLAALFAEHQIPCAEIGMGILYRGPTEGTLELTPEQVAEQTSQRAAAARVFGVADALLESVPDPESYRASVRDLVTGPRSVAARVAVSAFETLPYALSYKCDDCLYNEYCMKWSAEHDDLSLLPHLGANDKTALRRCGVMTTRELSTVKVPAEAPTAARDVLVDPPAIDGDGPAAKIAELVAAPGKEDLVRRLAATWPVGPRLDELVHRARRYRRFKGDAIPALSYIPSKGYGSLPYCDAAQNPNLVRIYIDAQHDYLHDRVYLLGSLVVASEHGVEVPERRRSVVRLMDAPPETAEREQALLVDWIDATLRAAVELAAPDENGEPSAPIHLIFFDRYEQRVLLDALARHVTHILTATPLYDFLTQRAAYDSPLVTYLDEEIRELKNYPMVCQSLQAVAAYLKFDWNSPAPYRELFSARLFDFWGKLNHPSAANGVAESAWYTARARFSSQIPLEYAYAAWGELDESGSGERGGDLQRFRAATPALLRGFHVRRLEAMEHIAKDFHGNERTTKASFSLPQLGTFEDKARSLAQALDEFVTIERHVELSAWKTARLAPPERRVLSGATLLVRYCEADQQGDVAARNRENERRRQLRERFEAEYRADHPDAKQVRLSTEQRKQCEWSQEGLRFRLRLETEGVDCTLDEALGLSDLRSGERIVVYPRQTTDERLPLEERVPFTPTPRQMLYGQRADIKQIVLHRDERGRVTSGYVEIEMAAGRGGAWSRGFVFGGRDRPLEADTVYTLDTDPNSWYGYSCMKVVEGLVASSPNTLYERLCDPSIAHGNWPNVAATAQARFLAGLDAFHAAGELHDFEPSKRDYIGAQGDAPILLVQGPPGTGKSYTTGFAVFARLQGALAAGQDLRVFVSCKTHAATDVLLHHIADVKERLRILQGRHPDIFAAYFDPHLLTIPLFRIEPKDEYAGIIGLPPEHKRGKDQPKAYERVAEQRHCVVGGPPGKIHRLLKDRYPNEVFGHYLCGCLVLDEASQMNLPEAMMAALPLAPDGALVVVGDHRQMPPIVKHDWAGEPRRTFQEYRAYESLFGTLLASRSEGRSGSQPIPLIQFSESFRLHADMADFLRREVYAQDGIDYHSRKTETLPERAQPDPFVAAVLAPQHSLVVVVHDEAESMLRNPFEQELLTPVLRALADPTLYNLEPRHGLGVVVPHRAQKAALQEALPQLTVMDRATGAIAVSAVDTVERFQGDERAVILVSATESDPHYLLAASAFLLDPRRLTVALSRAKQKMVLVASRSVFTLFSADEETFAHAQLWKNVLRRTCTQLLWQGERDGHHVEVWSNVPGKR
ncbi:MAG TPA: ATP-binding protein [Ktedonobacterales bacterium]